MNKTAMIKEILDKIDSMPYLYQLRNDPDYIDSLLKETQN